MKSWLRENRTGSLSTIQPDARNLTHELKRKPATLCYGSGLEAPKLFPIPPPNRLIDPRLFRPTKGGTSSHSIWSDLAEGVFALGFFAFAFAVAIWAASIVLATSPLLALVAASAGFVAALQLKRAPIWLIGLSETMLFTFLSFEMRVRGPDDYVSDPIWPLVALVAVLFLWSTIMTVRRRRE
ncbi:hypothetical protein FKO01_07145 [Mesorhizobium sp. B2-3-3]|nr:hypothetical protein FKO01_07145 [Mesorhizobium sp. B2-3-3]